jgi:hypothetical protein
MGIRVLAPWVILASTITKIDYSSRPSIISIKGVPICLCMSLNSSKSSVNIRVKAAGGTVRDKVRVVDVVEVVGRGWE